MVAKVTNIRPTIEDELTELLINSDSFVIIGKSEGDIKMASNADHKEVYMMLDVLKEELLAEYMGELIGSQEYH
jgi:histidinol phosphatase-like enzyme